MGPSVASENEKKIIIFFDEASSLISKIDYDYFFEL
jgi:hypothetical protein